jgi:hypothetical protein
MSPVTFERCHPISSLIWIANIYFGPVQKQPNVTQCHLPMSPWNRKTKRLPVK